jgi:hypothetical protein
MQKRILNYLHGNQESIAKNKFDDPRDNQLKEKELIKIHAQNEADTFAQRFKNEEEIDEKIDEILENAPKDMEPKQLEKLKNCEKMA